MRQCLMILRSILYCLVLVKSAKAKGRKLQNWVKTQLLFMLPKFGYDEAVTVAIMGESGADVKIIKGLQQYFPFKIECKSQKKGFSAIYDALEQCKKHPGKREPLVIIKQDRQAPLAVLDAEYFIKTYDMDDRR